MRPEYSDTTEELYEALGPWTEGDEAGDWQLLRYVASVGELLHQTEVYTRDSDDGPGWSAFLDLPRTPAHVLPFLAQMKGVQFVDGLSEEQQRMTIQSAQGFDRGSVTAIRTTAQTFLEGSKIVDITERDTSPYHFKVRVYLEQILGLSYAEAMGTWTTYQDADDDIVLYDDVIADPNRLIAALEAAKPAGLGMTVELTPGPPPA